MNSSGIPISFCSGSGSLILSDLLSHPSNCCQEAPALNEWNFRSIEPPTTNNVPVPRRNHHFEIPPATSDSSNSSDSSDSAVTAPFPSEGACSDVCRVAHFKPAEISLTIARRESPRCFPDVSSAYSILIIMDFLFLLSACRSMRTRDEGTMLRRRTGCETVTRAVRPPRCTAILQ